MSSTSTVHEPMDGLNQVLIVDDEVGMRSALETNFVRKGWKVETASGAAEALARFRRHRHPLVVTDIRMPDGDGFAVMREVRALAPQTAVILLTAFGSVPDAVTAMRGGACDYLPKQSSFVSLDIVKIRDELVAKIKAAAEIKRRRPIAKIVSRQSVAPLPLPLPLPLRAGHSIPTVVALGTSTGGPKALQEILPMFPADLHVPMIVVQHMPIGFTGPFAHRLNGLCKVKVKEAEQDEDLSAGTVYIGPAGYHLTVRRKGPSRVAAVLARTPEGMLHMPSVDVMMLSVAEVYRSLALGVIMTGMGADGAKGMAAIQKEGGLTVGQDEASCTVYGMPRSCAEMGVLQQVVSLTQIPAQVLRATGYKANEKSPGITAKAKPAVAR